MSFSYAVIPMERLSRSRGL